MKRFMFLSIGVLCLAIAALIGFYLGSQRAEAQSSSGAVYLASTDVVVGVLPNGDVYSNVLVGYPPDFRYPQAHYMGNFWQGAVGAKGSTWSGVKGQYPK
jgi:hypothetical protein